MYATRILVRGGGGVTDTPKAWWEVRGNWERNFAFSHRNVTYLCLFTCCETKFKSLTRSLCTDVNSEDAWEFFSPYCYDVRPSVRLSSVCLSGMGVHCGHTTHVNANLSLWLDSTMFWAPWAPWHVHCPPILPAVFFQFHLEERWVYGCANYARYLKNGWR